MYFGFRKLVFHVRFFPLDFYGRSIVLVHTGHFFDDYHGYMIKL